MRADFGALQNRLESTIANLQVNHENLSASRSRITDADFAQETAHLAKSQIIQQSWGECTFVGESKPFHCAFPVGLSTQVSS